MKTTWADLSEGDRVYIGWKDFIAHHRPPVYKRTGPHTVVSVRNHELTNGNSHFRWEGDLWTDGEKILDK